MASSRSSSHGRSPSCGPTSLPAHRRIRRTQGARRRAELDVVSWSTLLLLRTSLEKFPFGHETSGALRAFYNAFTTGSERLFGSACGHWSDGLVGQAVERLHGELEVLFFRVLEL